MRFERRSNSYEKRMSRQQIVKHTKKKSGYRSGIGSERHMNRGAKKMDKVIKRALPFVQAL